MTNIARKYYYEYYQDLDYSFLDLNEKILTGDINNSKNSFDKINKVNTTKLKERSKAFLQFNLSTYINDLIEYGYEISPHYFVLEVRYPGFLSGSGLMHDIGMEGEFKLGFTFDHTTGLPCIDGSSVKGKIARVFPRFSIQELKLVKENLVERCNQNDEYYTEENEKLQFKFDKATDLFTLYNTKIKLEQNNTIDWENPEWLEFIHRLEQNLFQGYDTIGVSRQNMYDRDQFHTAHISRETARHTNIFADDTINPHNGFLKEPLPVYFLKINPGVKFRFCFNFKDGVISSVEKCNLTKEILLAEGIGAKNKRNYGRLR
ncbi:MAG: type III-B CRISPR module RAMP protein Cmr6 [Saprospiraceae bacterium]|nr:type III-B CRISPR module RAMP protein Cmr6 [Saprospiraceae bacterium]